MEALLRDFASAPLSEHEILALVMTAIEGRASGPEIYTGFALERSSDLYWVWDAKFSHLRRTIAQDTHHESVTSPAAVFAVVATEKGGFDGGGQAACD